MPGYPQPAWSVAGCSRAWLPSTKTPSSRRWRRCPGTSSACAASSLSGEHRNPAVRHVGVDRPVLAAAFAAAGLGAGADRLGEGGPVSRGEDQLRAVGVLGIAYRDGGGQRAGHLDAVAAVARAVGR